MDHEAIEYIREACSPRLKCGDEQRDHRDLHIRGAYQWRTELSRRAHQILGKGIVNQRNRGKRGVSADKTQYS